MSCEPCSRSAYWHFSLKKAISIIAWIMPIATGNGLTPFIPGALASWRLKPKIPNQSKMLIALQKELSANS
jgi:hypothetical protein